MTLIGFPTWLQLPSSIKMDRYPSTLSNCYLLFNLLSTVYCNKPLWYSLQWQLISDSLSQMTAGKGKKTLLFPPKEMVKVLSFPWASKAEIPNPSYFNGKKWPWFSFRIHQWNPVISKRPHKYTRAQKQAQNSWLSRTAHMGILSAQPDDLINVPFGHPLLWFLFLFDSIVRIS